VTGQWGRVVLTGFVKARVTGVDSRRRARRDLVKPTAEGATEHGFA